MVKECCASASGSRIRFGSDKDRASSGCSQVDRSPANGRACGPWRFPMSLNRMDLAGVDANFSNESLTSATMPCYVGIRLRMVLDVDPAIRCLTKGSTSDVGYSGSLLCSPHDRLVAQIDGKAWRRRCCRSR